MSALKDLIEFFTVTARPMLNKGRDKRTLGNLLKDPPVAIRQTPQCTGAAIGRDEQTTRRLLNELGARQTTLEGDGEGWTLR
jgi:hypothetical protein